jgi:ribosomal protein S18 acetylase RimI-like enzyme
MAHAAQLNGLRRITEDDAELVAEFLRSIPEGDRTFFKEDTDLDAVRRWRSEDRKLRWLLIGADGTPQAYVALIPGVGWSAHVGELSLVVGQSYRRRGLGRALSRFGLLEGVRLGLQKITVEVVAEKEGDLQMFTAIGFEPEALLKDQIKDREGQLHDLVLLAHDVEEVRADMEVVGLGLEEYAAGSGA